ncbi:aldo/keto reductase [Erythrobacter sp. LQ02-29]|uniref:aldo/keto reductase n=1 Tax=Erythrobacter sp. LQ02-29 TaxID=2920384 RepID=UPI001F4DAD2A|nr:aldo/keto reductase [Erythrobacter sp. LQ02-29]MCP9223132.1 aldo/keto reductase [Erythrobacter sp. LQ02-29]
MTQHSAIGGLPLSLGGNVFGWTADRDDGFAVLDKWHEAGGRMIDTADVYSAWVDGHEGGESERFIGEWMEDRGVRDDMLIATKTGMLGESEHYRADAVSDALDRCLERLRTDRVELFYCHKDNEDLPIETIAESFAAVTDDGRAKSIGASNFTVSRLRAALDHAEAKGITGFTALQNQFNLVERDDYGQDMQRLCLERGIAMFPYFSLAAGYLTGKYRDKDDFGGSRRSDMAEKYKEDGPTVLAQMDRVAQETGAELPAIALAWLAAQPGIAAPLASARNLEQMDGLLAYTELELSRDQIDRLTRAGA